MASFEQYSDKFETVNMTRRDGILQMTFHTNGGPLQWGEAPHRELPEAFRDVGSDPENKVVIMTGTGDAFSGRPAPGSLAPRGRPNSGTRPTGKGSTFWGTCWISKSR